MSWHWAILILSAAAQDGKSVDSVGVVCRVKLLSDKVPDVSSLEAWKRSFLRKGMSDSDKAIAAWKTTVMFQHQEAPPNEFLQNEDAVMDPIKMFNVYGYSLCSVASCDVECLARAAGLAARGWGLNGHSVPEVFWDGSWHMLDASLINYFPKADGTPASFEEIVAAVQDWHERNPGYKGDGEKLVAFQRADGWTGWKKGPDLLARCPFYDKTGWWPARTHGWYSTMQEYDGTLGKSGKPFLYEYGYSEGYEVDIRLRRGERLTRNWSNIGLHVNRNGGGGEPGCLKVKTGSENLVYTPQYGDIAPGRIGNGTLEWQVPLTQGAFRSAALESENLDDDCRVRDPSKPARLELRMPSSYVYLSGKLSYSAALGAGGSVAVSISTNNGLDYRSVSTSSEAEIDLTPKVFRRYDYRLRFELQGQGTGLKRVRLAHDIQHSQRALPALDKGTNAISFSAGPAEGTITIEGSVHLDRKDRQLVYSDFHPEIQGMEPNLFVGSGGRGSIAFPVRTPGEMVRLRFGAHYRARDPRDGIDYQVSFDGGKAWRTVERAPGGVAGFSKYVVCREIPPGATRAIVRYAGTSHNATGLLGFRIDADYKEPRGGFSPVRVTYSWEEEGRPKSSVFIAKRPSESYTITCAAKPVMRSIVLELAD